MMDCKRFLALPVFAVLSLMGFVYYITIFVFIEDWVGLRSSPGTLNAAIFTILALLSLFSFFVCVLTDPGRVPSSYVPDVEGRQIPGQETTKDTLVSMDKPVIHMFKNPNGKLYFNSNVLEFLARRQILQSVEDKKCDKCLRYKPPRTHHCRVCRRCVLKMDHHCVWMNNCVGYWNYKAFFVLSLYATAGSIHAMVIMISCVLQKDRDSVTANSLKIFYVTCGVIMVTLVLTLVTLSGWHVYLILHNMTTIEYYEGNRAKWLARKSGQSYRHPYNNGAHKNITLILGPNMMKWLWPTAVSHLKDGLSFPTLLHDSS